MAPGIGQLRPSGLRSVLRGGLAVSVGILCVSSALASSVKVELEGLEGPLQDNVEATLSIRRAEGDLRAGQIKRLHGRAAEEIRRALEPFGYYRPDIRASPVPEGDDFRARYEVDAGEPIRLRTVEVRATGAGAESDPRFGTLVDDFPLAAGDVLDHSLYTLGKNALALYAARKGYLDAKFDSSAILVDLAAYEASVVLHFDTGIRYRYGEITLEQEILYREMVQGYLEFAPGDPYDIDDLIKLQGGLVAGPYFSSVEIHPGYERKEGDRIPIRIVCSPARPIRWEVGAGYGTDTGVRGSLGVEFRRLNRRGHYANIDLEGSEREFTLSSRYTIPWPYPRTEELSFLLGIGRFDPGWATSNRATLGASLSRVQWGWREMVSLTYEFDDWTISDTDEETGLLLLTGSLTRTVADNLLDPTRGRMLRFEVRAAHDAVLSGASLLRGTAEGRFLRSLVGPLRGFVRGQVGGLLTDDFNRLPPGQRFVTGGVQTVRGYTYESLGPHDANGKLVGGNLLAYGSAELEYRFLSKLGLAAFLDSGNAFRDTFDEPFQVGVGTGIRWASPVGLVRLDGAWGVTRGDDPFHIHFMIGPVL